MTARVFVRGGSTAIVENVNHVEIKDGFFHLYDMQESETVRGVWRYIQKAIFACDIVEKIFIEDEGGRIMAPLCRLLMAVLSNIVHEECCCYCCPLCELTGIDKACEHPNEVIAFALDSDPLVIESIVSEVKRNAKP